MTRPTQHPKTGVYRVRLTIPPYLRETTQRLYGVRAEFVRTLGTKSERDAAKAGPAVVAEFEAKLRSAEAAHRGGTVRLSDHDISALCGRWLAQQEAVTVRDLPHDAVHYEGEREARGDVLGTGDGTVGLDTPAVLEDAKALLAAQGLSVDVDSFQRLTSKLVRVQWDHYGDMERRATTGRWRPTITSAEFPPTLSSDAVTPAPTATVTLDAMLDGWGLDRGWARSDKPMDRAFYDRLRTIQRLGDFLGHRDARRVTRDEVTRWKAEMQGRKLNAATIRNDMSEMSAIWKWGMAHELVSINPFAGLLPPKAKRKAREPRSFTPDEARTILLAARQETGALRWLPWLLCFTGARLNEACQAERQDITTIDGVCVLRIHDDGEGRSVKNADSRRTVPLHPALVAEGFLDYTAALPRGSSLWPDLKPDTFGRRSGTGGRKVARWMRETLKITDPLVSPNHSWRHTFIDACRRVVMPPEVRSAITGHSGRMDESAGYGAGMGTMVQVMAEHLARVPSPLSGTDDAPH